MHPKTVRRLPAALSVALAMLGSAAAADCAPVPAPGPAALPPARVSGRRLPAWMPQGGYPRRRGTYVLPHGWLRARPMPGDRLLADLRDADRWRKHQMATKRYDAEDAMRAAQRRAYAHLPVRV